MRVCGGGGQGKNAPFSTARSGVERMLATTFVAIRGVHVLQGLLCSVSGRRAYRRPVVAAAVEAAAAVEFVALSRRYVGQGGCDARGARADAAFGLAGLVALAFAMDPVDRTSSLNWMLPLTVGSTLGSAALPTIAEGVVVSAALGATYAVTTADATRVGGGRAATAMANALSYPGFFVVASLVTRFARRMATELEEARRLAVDRGARLAAEAATNREHRLLHDSALQTLEAIAAGSAGDPDSVRRHAWREAETLRLALRQGTSHVGGMIDRLSRLCAEFAEKGLRVELVAGELEIEPGADVSGALCDATREALANVVKHGGVDRAHVRVTDDEGAWLVTIRDHGRGFEASSTSRGFGLDNSIEKRLAEVGGWSRIESAPSQGTRVELGVPR